MRALGHAAAAPRTDFLDAVHAERLLWPRGTAALRMDERRRTDANGRE
jgi:hypothetical protein